MKPIIARAKTLVRSSPNSVYKAFVDAETMSKFWFTRRDKGLVEGETVHWYVGVETGAYAIEVRVKKLQSPNKILIEWGKGDTFTQVQWQIVETEQGMTELTIEESGFTGSNDAIIDRALDSTGGFNQVAIALKSLLEHDSQINVVTDHI